MKEWDYNIALFSTPPLIHISVFSLMKEWDYNIALFSTPPLIHISVFSHEVPESLVKGLPTDSTPPLTNVLSK
jgi:hypothetical protein